MKLKELIERKRAEEVKRNHALEPVIAELEDCAVEYKCEDGQIVYVTIPGNRSDRIVIRAASANGYHWGINSIVPSSVRVGDFTSLLSFLAEFLA